MFELSHVARDLKDFLNMNLARLRLDNLEAQFMNLVAQPLPTSFSESNLLMNLQQLLLLAFFEQQPMVEHRLKVEVEFFHSASYSFVRAQSNNSQRTTIN